LDRASHRRSQPKVPSLTFAVLPLFSPSVPVLAGTVFAASSANAMDLVAAVPQEVAAIADITPIAYFAFLGGSVAFALGTVSTPSTIPPRV
jgi:hypothetical protein